MKRKKLYMRWFNHYFPKILPMQDMREDSQTYGCFFYPYWKGKVNYVNSRWQEAISSILFAVQAGTWDTKDLKKRLEAGLEFLGKIQNKDGSFPEYSKGDRSFAATSFVTLAAADVCMDSDLVVDFATRAGDWLVKNNETVLTNQAAAAAAALEAVYRMTGKKAYLKAAQDKILVVLKNQTKDGYYKEKGGRDFGYSTLTLSMLSKYHRFQPVGLVLDSARKFITTALNSPLPANTRGTDWAVLEGFEYFFKKIPEAGKSIDLLFKNKSIDVIHIPDERHLCTDLHRHLNSYNIIWRDSEVPEREMRDPERFKKSRGTPRIIRSIGTHKLRKVKYALRR